MKQGDNRAGRRLQGAPRVFNGLIDSLPEIRLLGQSSLRYRRQMLALKLFRRHDSTVMVLDNMTTQNVDRAVHSIAHGVIHLEQLTPNYGGERRRLQVVKCRAQSCRGGWQRAKGRRPGA